MPTAGEYNQAIQNLRVTAADDELKGGEPALSPLRLPREYSGGFAVCISSVARQPEEPGRSSVLPECRERLPRLASLPSVAEMAMPR